MHLDSNLSSKQRIAFDSVCGYVFLVKCVYVQKENGIFFLLYILKNITKSYRMDEKQCHISPERKDMENFKSLHIKKESYFDATVNMDDEETLKKPGLLKWLLPGYWLDHCISELCEEKPGRYSEAFPTLPLL